MELSLLLLGWGVGSETHQFVFGVALQLLNIHHLPEYPKKLSSFSNICFAWGMGPILKFISVRRPCGS